MAIDFPVPSQVGEVYSDPVSGNVYVCQQIGPPTVWSCGVPDPTADAYVTIATTQEVTGVKTFSGDPLTVGGDLNLSNMTFYGAGGVAPTLRTIDATFDLKTAVSWTCGAISIPNPVNAEPGMTGQIIMTAEPSGWGSAFKFPGEDTGNTQPDTASYPAVVPYLVQNASTILLGTPIAY